MKPIKTIGPLALVALCTIAIFGFKPHNERSLAQSVHAAKSAVAKKAVHPKKAVKKDKEREHISQFVFTIKPKNGKQYADRVAKAIVTSARRNKISPLVVTTVAYIESEFSMKSKPCIGMMQISRGTAFKTYGKSGLNVNKIEDNIEMGTRYLAMHYNRFSASPRSRMASLASRGGSIRNSRSAYCQPSIVLRKTLGRYNGSGVNGFYQARATRVLNRLAMGNPEAWKKHINSKGALWKK